MEKAGVLINKVSIKIFWIILIIYWCLIATLDPDKAIVKYSNTYWLYISPVFLMLIVFFVNSIFNFKEYLAEFYFSKNYWQRLFVLWVVSSTCIAIYHKDWSALRIVIPWVMIVSSLIIIKPNFKLLYLNIFFALSLVSSVVSYHLNLSQFSYILGQSLWNCFSLDRVSLYPSLFDSAFISFIVLTFNIFYNKRKTRYLIFLISTYFIIFSASRTVYLCLGILIVFLMVKNLSKEKFLVAFGGITLISFLSLVVLILYPDALVKNQIVGKVPSLDKYVFHKAADQSCAKIDEEGEGGNSGFIKSAAKVPYYHIHGRGELLRNMYSEFKQSPLLGTGRIFKNTVSSLPDRAGGTESFIAGLFVRFGVSSTLFILSFVFLAISLYQKQAYAEFVLAISALVSWFLFGSSASIYNFNFLLTISLLLSSKSRTESEMI